MAENTNTQFVSGPISPYRLAKVLSEVMEREIAPQVLYTYTRKNDEGEARLRTSLNELGHQVVSAKDANEFIEGFKARAEAREAKKAEQAAAEELESSDS